MSKHISLKNDHLLPLKAVKLAEVMNTYENGVRKEELKQEIEEHDQIKSTEVERLVRLLRMTENVEVKDNRAHLNQYNPICKGIKIDPFKEQERKAKKENTSNMAEIRKERSK